jgi:hypothetical protein
LRKSLLQEVAWQEPADLETERRRRRRREKIIERAEKEIFRDKINLQTWNKTLVDRADSSTQLQKWGLAPDGTDLHAEIGRVGEL